MRTLIFACIATFALSSCSLGKDTADQNTQLTRQNRKVHEIYDRLVGNYKGTFHNTDVKRDEPVALLIFISNVAVTNPDGTPGSKEVPQALLSRDTPVVDYSLDVKGFLPEVGTLTFSNLGKDIDIQTISAKVSGGTISGTINDSQQPVGTFEVSRDDSPREDIEQRLHRVYGALEGTYSGEIPNTNRKLSVELSAIITGSSVQLNGLYRNLNSQVSEMPMQLVAQYRADREPPEIQMSGQSRQSDYKLSFGGTLVKDVMTVRVTSASEGFLGVAMLTKEPPLDQEDPAELAKLKQLQTANGFYRGNFKGTKDDLRVEILARMILHKATLTATYDAGLSYAYLTMKVGTNLPNIDMTGVTDLNYAIEMKGKLSGNQLTVKAWQEGELVGSAVLMRQE